MNYCKCGCGKSVKKSWATGHHRKGTTFNLSTEAKEKIRESKVGEKNPRYGKPGTMLGRSVSDETKVKIRAARAKQVFTPEHNEATSKRLLQEWKDGKRKREDLAWWKGGIYKSNQKDRKSPEYKKWRKAVFERDNYTCQDCGERGGELAADHIKPYSLYKELRTELSNGRTLCRPCHLKTPTFALRYDLMQLIGTQT